MHISSFSIANSTFQLNFDYRDQESQKWPFTELCLMSSWSLRSDIYSIGLPWGSRPFKIFWVVGSTGYQTNIFMIVHTANTTLTWTVWVLELAVFENCPYDIKGPVKEHPTMHCYGIPRHTWSIVALRFWLGFPGNFCQNIDMYSAVNSPLYLNAYGWLTLYLGVPTRICVWC